MDDDPIGGCFALVCVLGWIAICIIVLNGSW